MDKEIFRKRVKLQADLRRIRGALDSITKYYVFCWLKQLVSIKTTHALYHDTGPLN